MGLRGLFVVAGDRQSPAEAKARLRTVLKTCVNVTLVAIVPREC
jgi:hypothetical protein